MQSGESLLAVWGHTARAVDQAIATVETGIEVDPDGAPGPARDAMILEELSTL